MFVRQVCFGAVNSQWKPRMKCTGTSDALSDKVSVERRLLPTWPQRRQASTHTHFPAPIPPLQPPPFSTSSRKAPVQPPRFIRRNWRRTGGGCTLFPVTLPHRGSQGGCFKTKTKNLGFDSRLHVHTHTHSHPHTHSVTQAWKNIEYEFPLSSISMNKPTYT